jgi:hypothetical protein
MSFKNIKDDAKIEHVIYSVLIVVAMLLGGSGCGKASASVARAETIPSPVSGYTCFIIYNGDGVAVGGNCVKND